MPTYLAERYWPGVTIERLLEALDRGRWVMEQISSEGTHIRDVCVQACQRVIWTDLQPALLSYWIELIEAERLDLASSGRP